MFHLQCTRHQILHHNLCLLCQQVQLLINHLIQNNMYQAINCFVLPSVALPEVTKPHVVYQPALHYTVSKQVYEAITMPEMYTQFDVDAIVAQNINSKNKNSYYYKGDTDSWASITFHYCYRSFLFR